jgi:hypothetical protein
MRAVCLLRESVHYRRDAFCRGLQAAGYRLERSIAHPGPGDVMVIWNRYGALHDQAKLFERAGGTVLVTENGYLGKGWQGGDWYALAKGHHVGAGEWPAGGPERWATIGTELLPWRDGSGKPLILGQRGIGEPGIASPRNWAEAVLLQIRDGRIRAHPGNRLAHRVPLAADLAKTSCVITWHSGAALLALIAGVPVFYAFDRWIGAAAAQPLHRYPEARRDAAARLAMFERLAYAMWTIDEIAEGKAFVALRN